MFTAIGRALRRIAGASLCAAPRCLLALFKPAAGPPLGGALGDLARTKAELVAENALLRQQLIILRRQVRWPRCTSVERELLVLLASRLRTWRQVYGFRTS